MGKWNVVLTLVAFCSRGLQSSVFLRREVESSHWLDPPNCWHTSPSYPSFGPWCFDACKTTNKNWDVNIFINLPHTVSTHLMRVTANYFNKSHVLWTLQWCCCLTFMRKTWILVLFLDALRFSGLAWTFKLLPSQTSETSIWSHKIRVKFQLLQNMDGF